MKIQGSVVLGKVKGNISGTKVKGKYTHWIHFFGMVAEKAGTCYRGRGSVFVHLFGWVPLVDSCILMRIIQWRTHNEAEPKSLSLGEGLDREHKKSGWPC